MKERIPKAVSRSDSAEDTGKRHLKKVVVLAVNLLIFLKWGTQMHIAFSAGRGSSTGLNARLIKNLSRKVGTVQYALSAISLALLSVYPAAQAAGPIRITGQTEYS